MYALGMILPTRRYPGVTQFTVRLWDMFDGWMDIKSDISEAEALALWGEKTDEGTKNTKYADGDYYDIFPAETKMVFTPEFLGR